VTIRPKRSDWVVVKLSTDKRRTRRARKKQQKGSGAELPTAGSEQKVLQQEAEGRVDSDSDKDQAESERRNSEKKPISPEQIESADLQTVEAAQSQPCKQSRQTQVNQPEAGQKSGGTRVAENREGIFEGFSKINESVFSLEGVKKAAAWYIETSEKLANQALELQERATGWAKDTPWAPLFEAQNSFARKFVERSANAARTLWQIQPTE
jgi:hypothetical protein